MAALRYAVQPQYHETRWFLNLSVECSFGSSCTCGFDITQLSLHIIRLSPRLWALSVRNRKISHLRAFVYDVAKLTAAVLLRTFLCRQRATVRSMHMCIKKATSASVACLCLPHTLRSNYRRPVHILFSDCFETRVHEMRKLKEYVPIPSWFPLVSSSSCRPLFASLQHVGFLCRESTNKDGNVDLRLCDRPYDGCTSLLSLDSIDHRVRDIFFNVTPLEGLQELSRFTVSCSEPTVSLSVQNHTDG